MKIRLCDIRIDGGTQSRSMISAPVIEEYAAALADGARFPDLIVFQDTTGSWLADGFHRYHTFKKAGVLDAECDVRPGGKREAWLCSLGANHAHGLRRTNADKRAAVTGALADPILREWSDADIAKQCNVSRQLVWEIRKAAQAAESVNVYKPEPAEPPMTGLESGGVMLFDEPEDATEPREDPQWTPEELKIIRETRLEEVQLPPFRILPDDEVRATPILISDEALAAGGAVVKALLEACGHEGGRILKASELSDSVFEEAVAKADTPDQVAELAKDYDYEELLAHARDLLTQNGELKDELLIAHAYVSDEDRQEALADLRRLRQDFADLQTKYDAAVAQRDHYMQSESELNIQLRNLRAVLKKQEK